MDLRTKILTAFDSLENMRNELEKRLELCEVDWLAIPESESKWSVNQVLTHLSDAEYGTLRYIKKKMQGMDSLGKSDLLSRIRSKLLHWLLRSPYRYSMPKQLPQPSNELTLDELKARFNKNRIEFQKLLQTFPEESLDILIFKHPFAGRLSLHQTILFMEDHYLHHLKQIDRVLKSVENRGNS